MTCCLNLISYRNDFLVDFSKNSNPPDIEMVNNYSLNNLINYYKFIPDIECINFYFTTTNIKGNKIEMLKKVNIFLKEELKLSTLPEINFFMKTPNSYNDILDELNLISKKYNFSIFIDLNSTLSGNKLDLNSLNNNSYYIQHMVNNFLINKLFILKHLNNEELEYYNYKNLPNSYGRLNSIKSETNTINDDRTFLKKNLLKCNNLIHYLFNLLYRKKYINIFDILNNKFNKNYKQIQNILKKYDSWLFNYFNAISYFYNGNYKKSIEYINNCIKIKKYRIEPYLLLSKIHYFNKNFQNTIDCLNRFNFHNIFNYYEFNDLEINNFSFKFQYALAYKQLNKNLEAIEICNKLLKNSKNELHIKIILLYLQNLLEELNCSSKYSNYKHSENNQYSINNIELNYSKDNQYSLLPDNSYSSENDIFYINYNIDNNCILLNQNNTDHETNDDNDSEEKYNFWENIEMKNNETKNDHHIKKQNFEIKLDKKLNFFSFFQNNKQIYIISNLYPLIISHLQYENTEKQYLKQINKFQTDWNELEMVTKFVNIKNLYVGIAKYKKNPKIYKLLYLDYENFSPIGASKIFKINDFKIQDLITHNDNIYLLGKSKSEIFIYNYRINDFYFKFNIPINYKKNIFINVKNEIKLDIKINNYQIKNYQNYIISNDSPKFSINYDMKNKLLEYNNNYYQLDNFIYLPRHIKTKVEKSKDVYFYNKTDSIEQLYNKINELEYLIGDEINDCRYLIIEYEDLEKLSYINLSTIIENQTIIIALIPVNYINNEKLDNTILQNEFLSKLFLLNIAKKDDYIDFIIDNILEENQYDKRYNFMNIDLENIYNNCNIITYSIKKIDKINREINNFNNNLKNHKYKQYLLKNLNNLDKQAHDISLPIDLVSINIIKLILFHDQNLSIYYEKDMQLNKKEEFLLNINILKKAQILHNIENINESSLILIKNINKYLQYKKYLEEGCIIYLQTEQKLIFI